MINSYAGFFLFYTSLNILFFALILLLAEIEVNDFFHYFGFLRYFFGRTLIYMMLGIGLIINGISMNIETAVWQAIRIVQFVVGGISLLIALLNLARIAKHGCRGTQDNETGRDTTPRQQLPTTANASRPSTNQAPPATSTQNNPPWQTYQQDQHALADSAADASGPAYTL